LKGGGGMDWKFVKIIGSWGICPNTFEMIGANYSARNSNFVALNCKKYSDSEKHFFKFYT
jgi:hypothetical protein